MFERPLKLTHNDSHKVFFTSDTHFNHDQKFIYETRGYKDRYEHNDALIAKINEVVRPQDTLIHLGDFCLNITPTEFDVNYRRVILINFLDCCLNRRHHKLSSLPIYLMFPVGDERRFL